MTDQAFIQELKSIIAQEISKIGVGELQDDDYTVARLIIENNLTKHQARRILNNLFDQGLVEKVKVRNPSGGGAMIAYRPVEKK